MPFVHTFYYYYFRYHRSFSGKHGKPREDPVAVKRMRSVSSSVDPGIKHQQQQQLHQHARPMSQASSSRIDLAGIEFNDYFQGCLNS